jgi:cellulose synthase operon protein YhjU
MTNNDLNRPTSSSADAGGILRYWRGLGVWNVYFILKFALLWYGYLNFHPLDNLAFMAFLLFPIPSLRWHKIRQWIAVPIGFALFWYDTWLPGIDAIKTQGSQLAGFDIYYLWDLVNRFINWQMVAVGFVLIVGYWFISQWLRVTVFIVVGLVWLNIITIAGPEISLLPQSAGNTSSTTTAAANSSPQASAAQTEVDESLPPNNQNLTSYLNKFYEAEKSRKTSFPATLPDNSVPFDILIINICSLAWSDIQSVQLDNHPLWQHFDIVFDNFNSATSYSGPAAIRLLRASCGQPAHSELYSIAEQQCYLFDNLAQLGFGSELMLDHQGVYGNFLDGLRKYGGLQAPLDSQEGLTNELVGFDGGPIYNDAEILARWLTAKQNSGEQTQRSATFFNIIPLHDGDRFIGQSKTASYQLRAQKLFDALDQFIQNVEKSGRKVMIIVVPEHGAALVGDKMQISGLRDIPSPSITHVPVGIKLVNIQSNRPQTQIRIKDQTSYLAVSEIVARLVDGKAFSEGNINWQAITENLPKTAVVSENDNAIVMKYQDKYYVRLGSGSWVPYPAN